MVLLIFSLHASWIFQEMLCSQDFMDEYCRGFSDSFREASLQIASKIDIEDIMIPRAIPGNTIERIFGEDTLEIILGNFFRELLKESPE